MRLKIMLRLLSSTILYDGIFLVKERKKHLANLKLSNEVVFKKDRKRLY